MMPGLPASSQLNSSLLASAGNNYAGASPSMNRHELVLNKADSSNDDKDFVKGTVILSVLGGTSMPFGRYAALNGKSSNSRALGFADPGTIINFGFMILPAKRFGVSVSLSYFDNPVSLDRYVDYVSPQFELNNANSSAYKVKAGSWRSNTFLLGIGYKLHQERVSFEINFRAGLLSSRSPEISIQEIDEFGGERLYFEHASEQHFSLAAAPGMQFRVKLFSSLFINLNSEFLFTGFYMDEPLHPTDTRPYFDYLVMANFNLMGGLSYEFK